MGRLKNESTSNPINKWLLEQGFKEETGARGENGLTKVYEVDSDYVWITINLNECKIYVYKEMNCGGMLGDDEIDIRKEWFDSLEIFIENVDEELERWIG